MEEELNQNQEQNTQEASKHHKWLWPLVVVLVLAVIGVSAWAVYNKQIKKDTESAVEIFDTENKIEEEADEFANWKIYRNEDYGLEIKYPSQYEVKEWEKFLQISLVSGTESPEIQFAKLTSTVVESVSTFKSNLGGAEFGEELIYDREIEFNGEESRELEYTSAIGGINPRRIFIQRDNFTLSINFSPLEEHNQILSTFKFTDQDETADWQTYSGIDPYFLTEGEVFEIMYPPSWDLRSNIPDSRSRDNSIYFKELGEGAAGGVETSCFLSMGAGGGGTSYTKFLNTESFVANSVQGTLTRHEVPEGYGTIKGVVSFPYDKGEIVFEYYVSQELLDGECERNILDILSTFIFIETDRGEKMPQGEDPVVVCTQEAFICPDGTGVGRVPPTCEFAACP